METGFKSTRNSVFFDLVPEFSNFQNKKILLQDFGVEPKFNIFIAYGEEGEFGHRVRDLEAVHAYLLLPGHDAPISSSCGPEKASYIVSAVVEPTVYSLPNDTQRRQFKAALNMLNVHAYRASTDETWEGDRSSDKERLQAILQEIENEFVDDSLDGDDGGTRGAKIGSQKCEKGGRSQPPGFDEEDSYYSDDNGEISVVHNKMGCPSQYREKCGEGGKKAQGHGIRRLLIDTSPDMEYWPKLMMLSCGTLEAYNSHD